MAACIVAAWSARGAEPELRYNRDIRPILSDNCFRCHGADKGSRKAKLRLDDRDVAIEKGAIVPGKPAESELVKRIFTTNADDAMPPADSQKQLTADQKELLKRWIAQGAQYEPHWSFIAPIRPALPKVKDKKWTATPIDTFVLAQLEAKKIKPSPEADRRTLLRRLSLDLTGLPPTPDEVASFEKDESGDAYVKQVERLLASPHYGERMAVPWLDVVRFADTVGYHGDQNVNVFPYRDYVINAFNSNKRFDQFTIEQLAGDLLPNNTAEQRIATGFNRLNMMTREGGAQPKEYLAKYGADRVRTVGTTWMGLTVGCAECHDHKYDPVTTKDFYQLKAFFADVRQWGVYSDYKYTPNPDLKGWNNDYPFPPEEIVDSPYLKQREARLRAAISELARAIAEKRGAEFAAWKSGTEALLKTFPDGWLPTKPVVMTLTNITVVTNKTKATNVIAGLDGAEPQQVVTNVVSLKTNVTLSTNFTVLADGSMLFGARPDANPVSVQLRAGTVATLRLELLPHETHRGSIFRGKRSEITLQPAFALRRAGKTNDVKLTVYHADANHKATRYANGSEVIGVKDGWKTSREHNADTNSAQWLLDAPVQVAEGDTLVIGFKTNEIGCLRVTVSPLAQDTRESFRKQPENVWLASTAADTNAFAEYKRLHRDVLECRNGKAPTVVTVAWKPDTTRVLPRGNWQSEDGEVVQPLPPHFLPQPKMRGSNQLSRLDLAQWLVSKENPLTARTVVNRLWKQFFGSGLANPVDDLGLQGEAPSHPELLDWLAVEFRESGWDVKHVVRLIVTSSTYKQSSKLRPELRESDPNNRLLASQNPRRLDAEFVRDNALAISGLLNRDIGGPSAYPYQPPGYYANLQFPDRDYFPSKDERQYRRGVYAHWQRTFLQPMLANFDAPSREECIAYRLPSNTPQQALTLLNDPTFVEAARVFAQKLLRSPAKTDEERLNAAYQRALGRSINASELASLKQFVSKQREHLRSDQDEPVRIQKVGLAPTPSDADAVELAAWTSVCRVILNLHETITNY